MLSPNRGPVLHGTPAGYQKHRRTGTKVCDACNTAQYGYTQARNAARQRLVDEHPDLYEQYYTEELTRRGLDRQRKRFA